MSDLEDDPEITVGDDVNDDESEDYDDVEELEEVEDVVDKHSPYDTNLDVQQHKLRETTAKTNMKTKMNTTMKTKTKTAWNIISRLLLKIRRFKMMTKMMRTNPTKKTKII